MIIPITKSPNTNSQKLPPQLAKLGSDDIVLIEFQGALEVEGTPDNQLVGTLTIDPKTDKPSILIGHHLLEGKITQLPKPLAVMEKVNENGEDGADANPCDKSACGFGQNLIYERVWIELHFKFLAKFSPV